MKSADWAGNIGVTYERQFFGDWMLGLSADARYTDEYPLQDVIGTEYEDSFWIYDASVRVFSSDNKYELAVIGRNLGDEVVLRLQRHTRRLRGPAPEKRRPRPDRHLVTGPAVHGAVHLPLLVKRVIQPRPRRPTRPQGLFFCATQALPALPAYMRARARGPASPPA